jgi:hypothetical protein
MGIKGAKTSGALNGQTERAAVAGARPPKDTTVSGGYRARSRGRPGSSESGLVHAGRGEGEGLVALAGRGRT